MQPIRRVPGILPPAVLQRQRVRRRQGRSAVGRLRQRCVASGSRLWNSVPAGAWRERPGLPLAAPGRATSQAVGLPGGAGWKRAWRRPALPQVLRADLPRSRRPACSRLRRVRGSLESGRVRSPSGLPAPGLCRAPAWALQPSGLRARMGAWVARLPARALERSAAHPRPGLPASVRRYRPVSALQRAPHWQERCPSPGPGRETSPDRGSSDRSARGLSGPSLLCQQPRPGVRFAPCLRDAAPQPARPSAAVLQPADPGAAPAGETQLP